MAYLDAKERSRTMRAFNTYRSIFKRAYEDGRGFSKGRFWYQMNGARLERTANKNDIEPHKTVAACSALSPLTPWERNFKGAQKITEKANEFGTESLVELAARHTVFRRSAKKAVQLLRGTVEPLDALSGTKTWAFYRNLMGDLEPITVDSWMYKLVGKFGLSSDTPTAHAVRAIRRAVEMLSTHWGISNAQCQAVIWVHSRNFSQTKSE